MIEYERLFQKVLPVLQNKVEEFQYFQYDSITEEDIWNYCIQKKWRKKNVEELHLYEIVQTIFSLKPSDIVSHFQIQEFHTQTNWFDSINHEELEELLKPFKNNEENT